MDRIANGGARLTNCFCTNAICTPSRATILTGQYGHINGVKEWDALDNRRPVQLQKLLQQAGYQTAIFGKWHLGHGVTNNVFHENNGGEGAVPSDPAGFDTWCVLPGQGEYHDPHFCTAEGRIEMEGYVSDVITDLSIEWLQNRNQEAPFCLCVHHKAPHRPWEPGERYEHLYEDVEMPHPETYDDDYRGRPAAAAAKMRIACDFNKRDVKGSPPEGLSAVEEKNWYYQRYIKDYLRCVASVDASVGAILDYLDANDLAEDTIVVYTSDQGFFLGDHGWYDKRFIYEESIRMPFVIRYPKAIKAGTVIDDMLTNTDFAPTFLEFAGIETPEEMQGISACDVLRGNTPGDWQKALYYRYWDHGGHGVASHYGVRTAEYKLAYYDAAMGNPKRGLVEPILEPYWELYDLKKDPFEIHNQYGRPEYEDVVRELTVELGRLQQKFQDVPCHRDPAECHNEF
jgi:arylsulfatase A-like enzyme